MELLHDWERTGYRQEIGPGVYDIHSPRVPPTEEMAELLRAAADVLDRRADLGQPRLRAQDPRLARDRAGAAQHGRRGQAAARGARPQRVADFYRTLSVSLAVASMLRSDREQSDRPLRCAGKEENDMAENHDGVRGVEGRRREPKALLLSDGTRLALESDGWPGERVELDPGRRRRGRAPLGHRRDRAGRRGVRRTTCEVRTRAEVAWLRTDLRVVPACC